MDKRGEGFVRFLLNKYVWVYQREDGDSGIVIGETEKDVINELKKAYGDDDINLRFEAYKNNGKSKDKWNKDNHNPYEWGITIGGLNYYNYKSEGNVYVTNPA